MEGKWAGKGEDGLITLINSDKSESLICQFMEMVNFFIKDKTGFKVLGYHEAPTDSEKVMRLSVFLAEKEYEGNTDCYAWAREVHNYLTDHFSGSDSHSLISQLCPHCLQRPLNISDLNEESKIENKT